MYCGKSVKSNILGYLSKIAGKTFTFLATETLYTSWQVIRVVTW